MKDTIRKSIPKDILWKIENPKMFYCRMFNLDNINSFGNFGDQLGPVLTNRLFGFRITRGSLQQSNLFTIGSIIDNLEDSNNNVNPVVWGSGFISAGSKYSGPKAEFLAVRGQLSASRVPGNPALGDPALLLPYAFQHLKSIEKRYKYSFVVHFADQTNHPLVEQAKKSGWKIINPVAPLMNVLDEIAASQYVLSSSLHGLIVADSLGIPARWAPLSNAVIGAGYKFNDYYSVLQINPDPWTLDYLPSELDFRYSFGESSVKLRDIQDDLLSAFKYAKVQELPY